jgi:4'-phosphopantetheinyl transferase
VGAPGLQTVTDGVVTVRVLSRRASRAADREALTAFVAELTATDPALVRVVRRCPHCGAADHGRPAAEVDGRVLGVSLSRTAGALAVAVGPGRIGIDVERPSRVSAATLHVFTPGERQRARGSGSADVHLAACWAVKEAVLKRDGRGLRVDPGQVDAVLGRVHAVDGEHVAWFAGVAEPVTVRRVDDDLVLAVAGGGAAVAVQDRRAAAG